MINNKKPVKDVINEIMTTKGLSLEKIAGEIGVSSMTVYRWKRGLAAPKSEAILKALSNYLSKN